MASRRMLALAVEQGEALIDRAMVARVTRARLLASTGWQLTDWQSRILDAVLDERLTIPRPRGARARR